MLPGSSLESPMNAGKTLFAQLMEFLPWKTFSRIVVRYGGDSRVRTLSCGEQYRAMAFAQLTYRESLRDIETCCRSRRRSCTTWVSASLCGVRRWPTPMYSATAQVAGQRQQGCPVAACAED